jgi:16S rRNA (uracil1498-N3)-methyltransferase
MPVMRRIYLPDIVLFNTRMVLRGETGHYLSRVLRLRKGDRFRGFDGKGIEYFLRIENVRKDSVEAVVERKTVPDEKEEAVKIVFCPALTKSKVFEETIERVAEIGVHSIIPVKSARSLVFFDGRDTTRKLERWKRIVAEGCKVSGNSKVPGISEPVTLEQAISEPAQYGFFFWEQATYPLHKAIAEVRMAAGLRIKVFIGPEGGFTEEEAEIARRGKLFIVTLGRSILRVATAAVTALAVLNYEFSLKSEL